MTIGAVNPISAVQVSAMYAPKASNKAVAPASTPAPAPASTPAAIVQLSGVPSSVDADDKGLYSQVLRSSGANAAMGAVAAQDKKEVEA